MTASGLNRSALKIFQQAIDDADSLGIRSLTLDCGGHVLDFGVQATGGLQAGIRLAKICMAGKADIGVVQGDRQVWSGPWIQVSTDHPVEACMFSQYAGWPVKHGKFFAMGSGPMRVRRGREELLTSLVAHDPQQLAVGTLECDSLPSCELMRSMSEQCQLPVSDLWLAVAPTRSLAGCVQVVARSVETALHKLHELGFSLTEIRSAYGIAPLPPPTPDFAQGIGRTNDAILFGGQVTLWVDSQDEVLSEIGQRLPSCTSRDFGSPFAEIFARYDHDFYKVDPGLFSPAEVLLCNLRSGRNWRFGTLRGDLLSKSFGTRILADTSCNE